MSAPPASNWTSVAALFEPIASGLECGVLLVDENDQIIMATEPLAVMFGTTVEAIRLMRPKQFVDHVAWMVDDPPPLLRDRRVLPTDAKIVCEEFELFGPCRAVIRWVARKLTLPFPGISIVCSDVTAEVTLAAAFERMNCVDVVTKLPNRRAIEQAMDREISVGRRHGEPLSFALFAVDGLETINLAHGPTTGDHILRRIGRLVAEHVKTPEVAARWNGAQFVLMLPDTDAASALARAEALRAAAEVITIGGLQVTLSAGVAQTEDAETPQQALGRAQQRLASARAEGPNRVR